MWAAQPGGRRAGGPEPRSPGRGAPSSWSGRVLALAVLWASLAQGHL